MCNASDQVYLFYDAVLLGVRNKQIDDDSVPSDDVLKMFYEYIGAQ